jgi:dolichyl-phosphate-mannose--protein O-mannosyl transferase
MDAATLNDAIADVCPVISTSVGKPDDRATWSFTPGAGATQAQIDAGNNVIATIPIETKPTLASADFIGRFTNAEYRAATATTWRQTAGNAKNWDVVVFDPTVNLNKKKVTTLKTSLVTDGILTQARADVIFS